MIIKIRNKDVVAKIKHKNNARANIHLDKNYQDRKHLNPIHTLKNFFRE